MEQLTERQRRFAWEYWDLGNATRSAINAGYSEKTAHVQGPRLLKNVRIQELIKEYREESEALLRQQFSKDAVEARKVMYNMMADDDVPENVRLSAAKDFLDRAGFKPVEKSEVESNGELGIKVIWADDSDGD